MTLIIFPNFFLIYHMVLSPLNHSENIFSVIFKKLFAKYHMEKTNWRPKYVETLPQTQGWRHQRTTLGTRVCADLFHF